MKVNGSAMVAAPLPRVWEALRDPAVLVHAIPGCQLLEATGADTYKMTVMAGVASIKGTYVGRVALSEPEPPHAFVLRAQGQGAPGTVDAVVQVRLSEGEGGTHVHYDADATVGGMIGGVGQRMLGSVAKRTAGEFFAAVERTLTAPAAAAPPLTTPAGAARASASMAAAVAEPAAAVPAGGIYAAHRGAEPSTLPMAVAFGSGGVVALAGVAVGYLIGRRSRGRR
ncbi:SRPBCC family protein [Actinomadura sp. HBU206391]|uniref:SRPBCC family protein n=1 Tax=Actinomadura sp. HBU206391 TaxID=2731692 RepID=UPI001650249B|nr:carbon monoxide dehydrogenase subunit G [Actinomadura sp. HBU206391]MBC6462728.1 carbon monoxide dehydrogenase subunit G [Actinomadura sp. HBU206391]